jgi:hypothetical protein
MSLRERFLDALIDGHLGRDGLVSRAEFMALFPQEKKTYTGVFLSNSEMRTGHHSPTYHHSPSAFPRASTGSIRKPFWNVGALAA